MEREEKNKIISDEMNLGEFPLTTLADRIPKGVETLVSEDEIKHPVTGEPLKRKITVRGQKPFGLPTAKDEEILMGCLMATSKEKFRSRKVEIVPAEFLRGIKWKTDGPAYTRWKKGMDRWKTISIESEEAYWHKGKRKPVRDMVGILDRWQASGRDPVTGLPEKAFFVWGDFMWESFKAGNLRNIDLDFWLACESAVSKRLFRFFDKRFYKQERLHFGLKEFAVNKLGMSRKNSNGQIKQTLNEAHSELEKKKFCRAEYVGEGKQAQVVYYSLKDNKKGDVNPLEQELADRGVKGVKKLIEGKTPERIVAAIKNFDHRNACGENRKGGWLHDDIAGDKPYSFRDDYVTDEKKAKDIAKRKKAERKVEQRTSVLDQETSRRLQSDVEEFDRFYSSLTEEEQMRFRAEAIASSDAHRTYLESENPLMSPFYAARLERTLIDHWKKSVEPKHVVEQG